MVVLPALGGETISPLCPLPIGVIKSIIRIVKESCDLSNRTRSHG